MQVSLSFLCSAAPPAADESKEGKAGQHQLIWPGVLLTKSFTPAEKAGNHRLNACEREMIWYIMNYRYIGLKSYMNMISQV